MRPAKRLLALALTMSAGAGAIAAVVVAPASAGSTATTPTIKLMSTAKGKLLSVGGFVVYRFSRDGTGDKNTCVKIRGCSRNWPALTTVGKPHTGPGVKASLLGTTKLPNGKKQVTYAHHPIYKYAFNYPGQSPTAYVGVRLSGGRWYGVNRNGGAVK
jgi:predicted lipoprotein with Yx(FWY)xxD motif